MLKRCEFGQRQRRITNNGKVEIGIRLRGKSGARTESPHRFAWKMTLQDFSHEFPVNWVDFQFRKGSHQAA